MDTQNPEVALAPTLKTAHLYRGPHGRDPRLRRVIDFLARKGFIRNTPLNGAYRGRINLDELLWACGELMPEVFVMVPAARLKFARSLPGTPPADLRRVLKALRRGDKAGPDYQGHRFESVRAWANFKTKDSRAASVCVTSVHLRLPADLLRQARQLALAREIGLNALVMEALENYLRQLHVHANV